jgi:hypothetical protein
MRVESKDRLKWGRDILLTARDKLAIERDRVSHGHAIDLIQIITMVDAAALIAKEILEAEKGLTQ